MLIIHYANSVYASEEPPVWTKYLEIGTWVLLFLVLVPGTALGYFAESSLPNSPLYPIKRDIESTILALSSFNPITKSNYQVALAKTRVDESQQLFIDQSQQFTPAEMAQLQATAQQITQAQQSIATIKNPVQKAQLQQQLNQTTQNYKDQLAQMQQQLQNTPTASGHGTGAFEITVPTNIPQTANTQTSQSQTTTSQTANSSPALTTEQKTTIGQQLQDINTQLTTTVQLDNTVPLVPTDTPSNTPPPIATPSQTPYYQQSNSYGNYQTYPTHQTSQYQYQDQNANLYYNNN